MIFSSDVRVSINSVWLWLRDILLPVDKAMVISMVIEIGPKWVHVNSLTVHCSCRVYRAGFDLFTDLLFNAKSDYEHKISMR